MKIVICGLVGSKNLGEKFIAKSLCYLIQEKIKQSSVSEENFQFTIIDIEARNDTIRECSNAIQNKFVNFYRYRKINLPIDLANVALKRIARKVNNLYIRNIIYKIRHFIWNHFYNFRKRHWKYFKWKFQGADCIIIDGAGLLEYSSNEYQEPLLLISKYAEKYKLPVVYNAVGCAGNFDPKDYRCKIMMQAIRSDSVKYVSARDSLNIVQNYVNNMTNVKLLADAAFWTKEAYGISNAAQENMIGIGLIRGNALLSYHVDFYETDWIKLFSEIGWELKKRGYQFKYFTNGLPSDYTLGKKVIAYMGLPDSYLVKRPTHDYELLETIKNFCCLITCRMHSSIAAFSMGIPSVILSWNKKVEKYMDILGYPDRAITIDNFHADYIVNKMEEAKEVGITEQNINRMKNLAEESVNDYSYLFINKTQKL